jgi:CBS domain-containing protein
MDGGRVLRAVLAMRSGNHARATAQAARVGRFFALVFGLVGLFVVRNPMLVFVALFVWLAAAGEANAVQEESTLAGVALDRVMITDVRTIEPEQPLSHVVGLILAGFQQDFPVMEGGVIVGVLTRRDFLRALGELGEQAPVRAAMRRATSRSPRRTSGGAGARPAAGVRLPRAAGGAGRELLGCSRSTTWASTS